MDTLAEIIPLIITGNRGFLAVKGMGAIYRADDGQNDFYFLLPAGMKKPPGSGAAAVI